MLEVKGTAVTQMPNNELLIKGSLEIALLVFLSAALSTQRKQVQALRHKRH